MALLGGLLVGVTAFGALPASAGTTPPVVIDVTSGADSGEGSFRDAIAEANLVPMFTESVTIRFAPGLEVQLTSGGGGSYTLDFPDLILDGNGASIDAGGEGRILEIATSGAVSIDGLTFLHGDAEGSDGGALDVQSDGLELRRSRFVGNAAARGGAVAVEAGEDGVRILDTAFEDNAADQYAGMVDDIANDGGALWVQDSPTVVYRSTFDGNVAGLPASPSEESSGDGGAIYTTGEDAGVDVNRSTFVGNQAEGDGGAVFGLDASLYLYDSTFTTNDAGNVGGAAAVLDDEAAPNLHVVRSTVVDNQAGNVGANVFQSGGGNVVVDLSVLVTPFEVVGGCTFDQPSQDTDSWDSGVSCDFQEENGSTSGGDPELGPLQDNGGPTETMAPAPGSPLIDLVDGAECAGLSDQRGILRPQGDGCDVGALELTGATFSDVAEAHPFWFEVEWMAAAGISEGYQPGPTYRPGAAVTRQAMSAFLYRFAGEPTFTPPAQPTFGDVGLSHPFFAEVEWMADSDISTGTPATPKPLYKPAAAVSRAAMSAFLYRFAQADSDDPASATFTDVSGSHPFFTEIEWMADQGISTGYEPGPTYRPSAAVTRQAMSAFLYRAGQFVF